MTYKNATQLTLISILSTKTAFAFGFFASSLEEYSYQTGHNTPLEAMMASTRSMASQKMG